MVHLGDIMGQIIQCHCSNAKRDFSASEHLAEKVSLFFPISVREKHQILQSARKSVGYDLCNRSTSMPQVTLARLSHVPSRTSHSAWLWKVEACVLTDTGRAEKYVKVKKPWAWSFRKILLSLSEFAAKFSTLADEVMNSYRVWMM